ncbi:MAG: hypothetical protein RLZZ385_1245 [Pseudomonadota bacterium]
MASRIAVILGHPDTQTPHLCHALADAYQKGALAAGKEVRVIKVGDLDFPVMRSQAEWKDEPAKDIKTGQDAIEWADHLVIVYPLWLGTMPALLKAFLEQVARPGFAFEYLDGGKGWKARLHGRSARIVVTMGMPAFIYRWFYGAHSLKSLERNILKFVGIKPVRESLFGLVEGVKPATREKWLQTMEALGRAGA